MKDRPRFRKAVTLMTLLAVLTSLFLVVNVAPVGAQVISAAPTSGPVGTTVTVTTTTACPTPSVAYAIDFTDFAAATTQNLATGTLTAGGHLPGALNTDTIVIPAAAAGAGTITLWGAGVNTVVDRGGDDDTTTIAFTVTTATATFTPATGPIGTVAAVNGTGWVASDTITGVTVGGVAATNALTVDGTGALSGTITILATTPVGSQAVVITGTTSGAQTFAAAFTVTAATATLTPAFGPVGTVAAVNGTGWVASDTIAVGAVTVGAVVTTHTLTVDGSGVLSGNITIPTTAPVGSQAVVITGTTSGAQTFAAAFWVSGVTAVTPNPATASSAATYTAVAATGGGTYAAGSTISLTFPSGTGLPATISKSYVTVNGFAFAVADPEPVVNTVTRQVMITINATMAGPAVAADINTSDTITVVIAQAAGVTNPGIAKIATNLSPYRLTVATSVEGTLGRLAYQVIPTLAISPTSAVRLQPVTVTGKGWSPNASIQVPVGGVLSGSGTIAADGTFSFIAWPISSGALAVIDGAGQTQAINTPFTTALTIPNFTLLPKVSVSPATANVGATVTLSGFDFTASGTIPLNTGVTLGGVNWNTVANNGAAYTLVTVDSNGTADDIPAATTLTIPATTTGGAKTVSVTDGTLTATTTLTVNTPAISLSPANGPPGTQVTVTGSNFGAANTLGTGNPFAAANGIGLGVAAWNTTANGGGTTITVDASGNFTVSLRVPAAAAPGMNNVLAMSNLGTLAGAGFTVANRALTLSPASGPVGTLTTIGGANMTIGTGITIAANSITMGTATLTHAVIAIDSLGNISPTSLTVPALGTGAQTVAATDSGTALAGGTFTVTQPTISLDKSTGFRGDTITLTGSGWVPGTLGLVTITFATNTILTATPDANGDITALFVVPATAVGASLVGATDIPTNSAAPQTFTLLPPAITVDPTSGPVTTSVTITGVGFQPQTGVTTLTIGGASVMPVTPIVTDTIGGFTATFTVPGLAQIAQTVSVTVAGITATTAFTISVAPPSVAGATASISTQLVRVWGYAAGAWEMFDPADVPGSDLASLTAGRGYWVSVSEDVNLLFAANSYDLTAGWNLIGWR